MTSSIKSQPDPDDLEDFVFTKAEKVCRFGSVGNDKICPRSEKPKHGMNKICPCQVGYATHYIPLGRDISYNYIPEEASYCSYEFQQLGVAVATGHINIYMPMLLNIRKTLVDVCTCMVMIQVEIT